MGDAGTAPPGWYDDGSGRQRWWTGSEWGPYGEPRPATATGAAQWSITRPPTGQQFMLIFGWISFAILPVVVPLLIFLTEGKKDRVTRWHSAEATNLQVTWALETVLVFVVIAVVTASRDTATTLADVWIPYAVLIALTIVNGTASTVGVLTAWRGSCRRCLVAVPFLRAHRREGPPPRS